MARSSRFIGAWMDVLAIAAWGVLFLNYWLTGKLYLLIHPNYMWLTVAAAIGLLALAVWRGIFLLQRSKSRNVGNDTSHMTLLPTGWSSTLLLATAILGLIITPRAFASQTAIQRGVIDAPTLTRVKPQAFRASSNTEDKSIIDWVRTLTVYPEPDAYTGQAAKVQGFVIYPPDLPNQYLLISRFVLTCCAADAYPISLPVKLTGTHEQYKPDTWLEIQGQMMTETLGGKRQLVIRAAAIQPIEEPKNPYDY
ncbi:MAG: TIGR03943 family protein [Oscillatoriales cyanobacterium C42_A2020_001]|nr:TIGR03943 family protein [Leptolyngbyaceae cyanobacterium C42_A2020_001]